MWFGILKPVIHGGCVWDCYERIPKVWNLEALVQISNFTVHVWFRSHIVPWSGQSQGRERQGAGHQSCFTFDADEVCWTQNHICDIAMWMQNVCVRILKFSYIVTSVLCINKDNFMIINLLIVTVDTARGPCSVRPEIRFRFRPIRPFFSNPVPVPAVNWPNQRD